MYLQTAKKIARSRASSHGIVDVKQKSDLSAEEPDGDPPFIDTNASSRVIDQKWPPRCSEHVRIRYSRRHNHWSLAMDLVCSS
jgi:hypothetical protein